LCSHCQQPVSSAKAKRKPVHVPSNDYQLIGVDVSHEMDRMTAMVTYLAGKPTLDDVAQYLVLDVFRTLQPRTALISVFDHSGSVSAAGSFGLVSDVIRALRRLSLWDRSPSVDAIRDGSPIVFADKEALLTEYPWLSNHDGLLNPTIVWPLSVGNQRLGSVQIQFTGPVQKESVQTVFTSVTPILGLYLSLRSAADTTQGVSERRTPLSPNGQEPEAELTPRQLRILHLLAEGRTNPQIAARIGFSDSTVRQETMAIYRCLGAEGRRDAVHIAGLRGLLSEEPQLSDRPILTGQRSQTMV
jgi:DNA-binding CsgD family transcriptional regulator